MKVALTENTYFGYSREIEYIAALAGMLGDNLDGRTAREVYGEEFVARFRKKHRDLSEIINTMFLGGLEILECLMDYDMDKAGVSGLDPTSYRAYMEGLSALYQSMLDWNESSLSPIVLMDDIYGVITALTGME